MYKTSDKGPHASIAIAFDQRRNFSGGRIFFSIYPNIDIYFNFNINRFWSLTSLLLAFFVVVAFLYCVKDVYSLCYHSQVY